MKNFSRLTSTMKKNNGSKKKQNNNNKSKRFSITGNLKSMASKASIMKRRTAQNLFEIASKVKEIDPELEELVEKMEKYEREVISLKQTIQAFAPETRKYCNFLETAALETWKMSHAITDSQIADDSTTKVGKVQQTTKQFHTYQEQLGDTRRAICDVYEEEVMAPIIAVCDVNIPDIRTFIRQREDFRKDRNSYKRRLENAKSKSKIDEKKINHLVEKLQNAEDMFNDLDQTCKDAIRELLKERPKLLLALTGYMTCIDEFFSRTHKYTRLSTQFLPKEEHAFFKMSISSKLSDDTTSPAVIIDPDYVNVKSGLKSLRNARRRHSSIASISSIRSNNSTAATTINNNNNNSISTTSGDIHIDDLETDDDVIVQNGGVSSQQEQDELMQHRIPNFFNPTKSTTIVVNSSSSSSSSSSSNNNNISHNNNRNNTNNNANNSNNTEIVLEEEEEETIVSEEPIDRTRKNFSAIALYDYTGIGDEELSFKTGDVIFVLEQDDSGWAAGEVENKSGDDDNSGELTYKRGLFPMNYVRVNM